MKKRQWDEENWTAGQEEKKTGRIRAFELRIKTLIQTNLKKLTPLPVPDLY
jgi:hypothetical protein